MQSIKHSVVIIPAINDSFTSLILYLDGPYPCWWSMMRGRLGVIGLYWLVAGRPNRDVDALLNSNAQATIPVFVCT
jgi:hypothetical protein